MASRKPDDLDEFSAPSYWSHRQRLIFQVAGITLGYLGGWLHKMHSLFFFNVFIYFLAAWGRGCST